MIADASINLMQQYVDDVVSGNIPVCKFVRGTIDRHLSDLERESTPGFPYHFDRNAAGIAIDMFPALLNHSIGDYQGLPFYLEPWQAFSIGCIFGWKRDDDKSRRFRKVFWSMGRKNGKSTVAAGIAIRLASMDINPVTNKIENVAEIVLCATKREQADVIFNEILRMREQSPAIKKKSETINKQVTFAHNSGTIRTVGSDKSFDGLNPLCVVRDETHAWGERNRKFLDTMLTGSGSRSQALDLSVTTAGDEDSTIWLEEYNYAKLVATSQAIDPTLYAVCYELDEKDDVFDEDNWIKANPNLGVSLKIDFLRQMALPAKTSKIALNRFKRFHCNQLVSSTERAFDIDQWDACKGDLSDWRYADVICGGVDLGGRDDLAAWALVARYPVKGTEDDELPVWRYEIRTQSYIASDTHRDISRPPFADWCHTDLLRTTKFPISELTKDFIAECHEARVRDIAFDPHQAQPMAEELQQNGITAESMGQTTAFFNTPLTEFRQAMEDGRLKHDGNPLLRWCVGNAMAVVNSQEKWMLNKRDSKDKIDPLVAAVMAFWRAMVAPKRPTGNMFIY